MAAVSEGPTPTLPPPFSSKWPSLDHFHPLPTPTPSSSPVDTICDSDEVGAEDEPGGCRTPPTPTRLRRPGSLRLRGIAPARCDGRVEVRAKKEIPRLSVSLSVEEIAEDVWAFTGGRPARGRPKRRARHVQSKLDVRELYYLFCSDL